MTFKDLNLNKSLFKAIEDLGLTTPTTIQEKAFPVIMSGKDVIGIAQTGTGKTYAYLLPTLRLWKFSKDRFPQILIVVPTRELVTQVVEEVKKLSAYTNLVVVGAYGGTNIKGQVADVEMGLDVMVATPGRLLDLCLKGALKLKNIKHFIIDEVDEMLNLGFLPQLKRVIDLLPDRRQNLLFSATMIDEVEDIIQTFFNRPVKIEAAPVGTPLENIDQTVYYVKNFNTKVNLVKHLLHENEDFVKVLLFMSTKKQADMLFDLLEPEFEEKIGIIHSNKSQNFRFNSVNQFTSGETRVLIATDIVARGIDVSGVSHVINFDIPEIAENYIHRIGRTGRADERGNSLSFATPDEMEFLHLVEKLMNFNIPLADFPEAVAISEVLIDDEVPKVKMKNVVVPRAKKVVVGGAAFHEKKAKNQKVNRKVTRAEQLKLKYGKPKTRGQKRKKKK